MSRLHLSRCTFGETQKILKCLLKPCSKLHSWLFSLCSLRNNLSWYRWQHFIKKKNEVHLRYMNQFLPKPLGMFLFLWTRIREQQLNFSVMVLCFMFKRTMRLSLVSRNLCCAFSYFVLVFQHLIFFNIIYSYLMFYFLILPIPKKSVIVMYYPHWYIYIYKSITYGLFYFTVCDLRYFVHTEWLFRLNC